MVVESRLNNQDFKLCIFVLKKIKFASKSLVLGLDSTIIDVSIT